MPGYDFPGMREAVRYSPAFPEIAVFSGRLMGRGLDGLRYTKS